MNVNEKETDWDTFEEVIDERINDTSPAVMEDDVNEELADMNQNDLND